jgi:hypothetical protein
VTDVYRIGVSIALANGVRPVLGVIGPGPIKAAPRRRRLAEDNVEHRLQGQPHAPHSRQSHTGQHDSDDRKRQNRERRGDDAEQTVAPRLRAHRRARGPDEHNVVAVKVAQVPLELGRSGHSALNYARNSHLQRIAA